MGGPEKEQVSQVQQKAILCTSERRQVSCDEGKNRTSMFGNKSLNLIAKRVTCESENGNPEKLKKLDEARKMIL